MTVSTCAPFPKLSALATDTGSEAVLELLSLTGRPDIISFAGGLPSPKGFPIAAVKEAADYVLDKEGSRALQYSQAEGVPELREALAQMETEHGIPTTADEIQIVTGSQQALDLVARVFSVPECRLMVESPTYLGALSAFNMTKPRYAEIPVDELGMNPDALDDSCSDVNVAYVMPTFANPTGLTIDETRPEKLAEKARKYDFWLIEDDPYGELWYDKKPPVSLRHFAPERTLRLGTLSKVLSPGLRLGYIVAKPEIRKIFSGLKSSMDLHTSTFTQLVAARVISEGTLKTHIPAVRAIYKGQCKAMLDALDEFMPKHPEISWTHPTGGMFIWLHLPKTIDSAVLFKEAVADKVAFVPSMAFYAGKPESNHARLSFVTVPPEKIREGVKILAGVISRHL